MNSCVGIKHYCFKIASHCMQKQIGVKVISVKIEAIRILSVPHKLKHLKNIIVKVMTQYSTSTGTLK